MFNSLTLVITLMTIIVVISLCLLLKNKIAFKLGMLGISIDNTDKLRKVVNKTRLLSEHYIIKRSKFEENILRNQMLHSESILRDICDVIHADNSIYELAHSKTKGKMKENGFEEMDQVAFSSYVGSCIDQYRSLFTTYSKDTYLESPDFNDKIASIFNHALITNNYWSKELINLEAAYVADIESITKMRL